MLEKTLIKHAYFIFHRKKKVLSCMVARESNWFVLYIIKSGSEENNIQKPFVKFKSFNL
jgi:hypothetical protein